jgi:serine/threonine protein kinase
MKPALSPLRPGDPKEFDGWTLKGVIGEGGFSTIFLAEKNGQQAALKMIRKESLHDQIAVDRFFTEIKNLELLDHPNIAKYLDSNDSTSVPYFAVEYIKGVTIDKKVELAGPITGDEWLELALSLAETLKYCHSQNIIHKDVSPGNIVIGAKGPVFIDFGLSYLEKDPRLTSIEQSVGTPPFMSPEQFGSERSFAMDAFSLASTLVFAGTGHYPFDGRSKIEWQESICHDKPNFADLSEQQKQILTPLLFKSSSSRISLDVFIAQLKESLGFEVLNTENRKVVSEALTGADLKLIKTRQSERVQRFRARRSIRNLALSASLAGLAIFIGISLLSGANSQAPKSASTSIASPEPSASPSQLEAAFGGGQNTPSTNTINSKPSSCSEFSYRDNVEADVLKTCQALIKLGDLTGYFNIGFYYYEQGNTKEAINWWQKGADKKSALSMYRLAGVLYENGETSQAKKWYQACIDSATTDGGKSWCMNGLGKIFYQEKDIKESRRWYQLSANLGDQEGYYRVGMNYASTKEWQKALDNYLKIKNPNLGTKTLIAEAYNGLGNEDQALVWYKKAADDGSADALVNVGVIYYTKKDFPNAIQAWKKASALGSGTASYRLARLYSEQKNTEEAANYDKIGASQGEIGSIFFYGFYFQDKKDYKNAKIWYQKGVDRNDPTSMVQLGAILSAIDGDKDGACKLWVKAADLGNTKAKENNIKYCSANPSQSPYPIPSSDDLTRSLPVSKNVVVDEIFGRVFESGIDWLIPLSVTTDKVPPITNVQFRLVGYPDAPWFGLPYKLKNLQGGVYGQVDDLFLSILFKRQVCPEFRFIQESKGEIIKIWNKQQPECATDYAP